MSESVAVMSICLASESSATMILEKISRDLKASGFELKDDGDIALFADTGQDLGLLERWLRKTADQGVATRLVCIPRLNEKIQRGLSGATGAHFLSPGGKSGKHYSERILGELNLRLAPQPSKGIVGHSKALKTMLDRLDRLADNVEPVLIYGESGTGKELCASYLHQARGKGEQLTVGCNSLRKELVYSELFGHQKGAFTDARQSRKGMLLEAGEGTLFLDEIGEMPLDAQAALLRVVEYRKIRPVGGSKEVPIEARLVLATNRKLEQAFANGTFREDLYRRIEAWRVDVPPLRERMEDVPLLVNHFIDLFNKDKGKRIKPPASYDCFFGWQWPGNVRQLLGFIGDAFLMQKGKYRGLDTKGIAEKIFLCSQEDDLQKADASIPFFRGEDTLNQLLDRSREYYFTDALARFDSINEEMEALCGCKKSLIYKEVKRLGLK